MRLIINTCKIFVGKRKGRDHLEYLGLDGVQFKSLKKDVRRSLA